MLLMQRDSSKKYVPLTSLSQQIKEKEPTENKTGELLPLVNTEDSIAIATNTLTSTPETKTKPSKTINKANAFVPEE